ncbi:MAG: hypothetical protein JST79_16140 [Acidobacteria bacterium]|nr:hypothetical protein [Acidobacteriota bacterium]
MGVWGKLPWENDGAGDWFDGLFERTQLHKQVEKTLQRDLEDSHEEIRAAASILLFLGRPYVWPIRDLDRHLALAADRLEAISQLDTISESPELVEEIRSEALELRSRIASSGASPLPARKWWQFWN